MKGAPDPFKLNNPIKCSEFEKWQNQNIFYSLLIGPTDVDDFAVSFLASRLNWDTKHSILSIQGYVMQQLGPVQQKQIQTVWILLQSFRT